MVLKHVRELGAQILSLWFANARARQCGNRKASPVRLRAQSRESLASETFHPAKKQTCRCPLNKYYYKGPVKAKPELETHASNLEFHF
jgi:hypothetical protein